MNQRAKSKVGRHTERDEMARRRVATQSSARGLRSQEIFFFFFLRPDGQAGGSSNWSQLLIVSSFIIAQ
jgi:hypothetical protein